VAASAGFLRATQAWAWLKLRWPTLEIREIVVFLLLVQLMASARLFTLAIGARGFAVLCAGLALVIYAGAVRGERIAARRMLGWIGAPWRQWAGAAVAGCLLGALVTAATVVFGHSIRVTEPVHNQVLAVTLGPIVEEICLRGAMVPLLARLMGSAGAVFVTSAVFALLHWPASLLKLTSIGATGAAYGWIRVRSGSTALAGATHAMYNLTVSAFGLL
jgi:membrane protease YdiL (CAAX protease family)